MVNAVADPGFPGGAPTYYLSYFLRKIDLHAIKKNWTDIRH